VTTETHTRDVWLDNDWSGDAGWSAACSCGWQGRYWHYENRSGAIEEWETHVNALNAAATLTKEEPDG
jgi:hypothetical protein